MSDCGAYADVIAYSTIRVVLAPLPEREYRISYSA